MTVPMSDGTCLKRPGDVDVQIRETLCLPREKWPALAPDLKSEALTHLIRHLRRQSKKWIEERAAETSAALTHRMLQANEQLVVEFMVVAIRRATVISRRWAKGRNQFKTAEILKQVQFEIVCLILAEEPSLQSEFLEVAFALVVQRRTLDAVEKQRFSAVGHRDVDEDGRHFDWLSEVVADHRANPEEALLRKEREELEDAAYEAACGFVKNPQHREAVVAHVVEDIPITDLEQRYNKPRRRVYKYINKGLDDMRRGFGLDS